MSRTDWVIKVLEDSKKRSIGYGDKNWIRRNSMDMNIRVCVENCNVDLSDIEKRASMEGSLIIQNGEEVKLEAGFNPDEEALLLIKQGYTYLVYQYFPKD